MNSIGNDALRNGLLKRFYFLISSRTDYTTLADENFIPGLDIAFYRNRGIYHTSKDSTEYIKAESLQHLGENVVYTVDRLMVSDFMSREERLVESVALSFYDFAGLVSFSASKIVSLILNVFICIVLGFFAYSLIAKREFQSIPRLRLFYGPIALISGLILNVLLSVLIQCIIIPGNRYYGYQKLFMCCSVFIAGISVSLVTLSQLSNPKLSLFNVLIFWIFFQLFNLVFIILGITAFYIVTWYSALFLVGCCVLFAAKSYSKTCKTGSDTLYSIRYILFFPFAAAFPFIVNVDMMLLLLDGLLGTIVDSNSILIITVLFAFTSYLLLVNFTLFIDRHSAKYGLLGCSASLLIISIFLIAKTNPYSSDFPLQLTYYERHTSDNSIVVIKSTMNRPSNFLELVKWDKYDASESNGEIVLKIPKIKFGDSDLPIQIQDRTITLTEVAAVEYSSTCQCTMDGEPCPSAFSKYGAKLVFESGKRCTISFKFIISDTEQLPSYNALLQELPDWACFRSKRYKEIASLHHTLTLE